MMKKTITIILILVLGLVLAAGCAKQNQETGGTSPQTAAAGKTQAAEESAGAASKSAAEESNGQTAPAAETASAAPSSTAAAQTKPVGQTGDSAAQVRVLALKGPTAMGLVQMMQAAQAGEIENNPYRFEIISAIDEIAPKIVKGDVDIATVPANLASVLYNNTQGKVQVLAINTLGVLTIAENGEQVRSIEDLRGKTLYASGKGATPEYALNYILRQNGLNPEKDLTIEWKSEHAECVAALVAEEGAIAMLPQPFATTAVMKSDQIRLALDLNSEWDKVQEHADNPSGMITGVVIARTDFVARHPEVIADFLKRYEESVQFVHEQTEAAAKLVGAFEIVPEQVALKALPLCNITFIKGAEMQSKLSGYLSVLFEQNPKAVGGQLPNEAFYYKSAD